MHEVIAESKALLAETQAKIEKMSQSAPVQSSLLLETLKIVRLIKHELVELANYETMNFKITDYKYPSLSRESITDKVYATKYYSKHVIIGIDNQLKEIEEQIDVRVSNVEQLYILLKTMSLIVGLLKSIPELTADEEK